MAASAAASSSRSIGRVRSTSDGNRSTPSKDERLRDSPALSPLDDDEASEQMAAFGLDGVDEDDRERELALAMGAGEPIRRQLTSVREERMRARKDVDLAAAETTEWEQKDNEANDVTSSSDVETRHGSTHADSNKASDRSPSLPHGKEREKQEKQGSKCNGSGSGKKRLPLTLKAKVLHFTPSWFSVTMGTGVLATLLNLLGQIWGTEQYSPKFASVIRWPALFFLILDIAIFLIFAASFIARYILFPKVLFLTVTHPQQSMFLGTVPMGLVTITSNISQLGTTAFGLGQWPSFVALGLWFVCAAMSLLTAAGVPWSIITFQKEHRFEGTTAALLLPIVPPITVAASGSVLIDNLGAQHPTLAFTIMAISYMQLGIGLPLALGVLVIYLQRLILFKAPPREVIVSVFLPLGPCGQGGEAALHLGRTALTLFPAISHLPNTGVPQLTFGVGEALYGSGLIVALLLFALGMWWAIIGVATFLNEYFRGYLKFNMGFWSFTFPLASLCICTARLAIALDSLTLKIVYTIMTLANFSLWVYVAIPTVKGFYSGRLLVAPCIIDLPIDPLTEKM